MPDRADHRSILELASFARATQQEPAATHVAAADEVDRENEPVFEHPHEYIGILPCRDAPEQDDLPLFAAVAEPETRYGPSKVEEALQVLDPDGMSPREAMDALYRLKALLS